MNVDALILQVAAAQVGVVARPQLLAVGVSPEQIKRRLRSGLPVGRHTGVYRLAGRPASLEQRMRAALLAAGPVAALAHRTSARVLDLRGARNYRRVEIAVAGSGRPRLAGVEVHRSSHARRSGISGLVRQFEVITEFDLHERVPDVATDFEALRHPLRGA